jgi:hypothetical protein
MKSISRIHVYSADPIWQAQLASLATTIGAEVTFSSRIEDGVPECDLILVDQRLLPPPESPELTRIYRILNEHPVLAVYRPGLKLEVSDVRKSFLAGATDLVEQPVSPDDLARLVVLSAPTATHQTI